MRPATILACSLTLAGASACATSESNEGPVVAPDAAASGKNEIPDIGSTEPVPNAEASDGGRLCSDAGWCATSLPDTDLVLRDIWPLSERAFAIAESQTLGVKVLEWDHVDAKWKYIDDGTQNDPGVGWFGTYQRMPRQYAGKIWAPDENEVYYGAAPGHIYHGKRPAPPATVWTWTRHLLHENVHPNDGFPRYRTTSIDDYYPALGVWGTSRDDVYAWFANTIYHRRNVDGDAPAWFAEYVAGDPADSGERLFFVSAAGANADDVWFSGARSRDPRRAHCALVVRRTAAGYQKIADGIVPNVTRGACMEREGALMIDGAEGWLSDIQAMGPHELVGLKGALDVVRISADGGTYSVTRSPVPEALRCHRGLHSSWAVSDNLWLSGFGCVVKGTDIWNGGGYQLSTVSLPAPLNRALYQVRGTSNTNLWAIGAGYALHKTTP